MAEEFDSGRNQFWTEVKKMRARACTLPSNVADFVGDEAISEMFKDKIWRALQQRRFLWCIWICRFLSQILNSYNGIVNHCAKLALIGSVSNLSKNLVHISSKQASADSITRQWTNRLVCQILLTILSRGLASSGISWYSVMHWEVRFALKKVISASTI